MAGKHPVLRRVRDVEGTLWNVRDVRTTKFGFDLLFGSRVQRGKHRGPALQLIATRPLLEFWADNRAQRSGVLFDLPGSRSQLKRLRRRFGFNNYEDLAKFWKERAGDLRTLSVREFAERHNVSPQLVFDSRRRTIGPVARPLDWWLKPKVLKVLRSGLTLREIGEKLSISITHAKRLRDRAQDL